MLPSMSTRLLGMCTCFMVQRHLIIPSACVCYILAPYTRSAHSSSNAERWKPEVGCQPGPGGAQLAYFVIRVLPLLLSTCPVACQGGRSCWSWCVYACGDLLLWVCFVCVLSATCVGQVCNQVLSQSDNLLCNKGKYTHKAPSLLSKQDPVVRRSCS
jgi:hypothetical protein